MSKLLNGLKRGIITENPILVLVLGMCPTLATTSSMATAVGMGVAATIVLICSNIFVSLLRKIIPDKVRIAAYIAHPRSALRTGCLRQQYRLHLLHWPMP